MDFAIIPYKVLRGSDEECNTEFRALTQKMQDTFISPVNCIEFNQWTLLSNHRENRKKVDVSNRSNAVLQQIFEQVEKDNKIGAELMKKRVRTQKAKNIREDGPDADNLAKYRQAVAPNMSCEKLIKPDAMNYLERARGDEQKADQLKRVDELNDEIRRLTDLQMHDDESYATKTALAKAKTELSDTIEMLEVPDGAVQVNVFRTDCKSNTFTKNKMYTQADEQ